MRKFMILGLAVCLIVGLTACKKGGNAYASLGKYAEVGPVMDEYIGATEKFVADLEKAGSADSVAAALEAAAATMGKLAPQMKAIGEKFPEFKTQDNPPAELKPFMDRIEAVFGRVMGAMGKIGPYMQDPKVVAAQEKYQAAMAAAQ